MVQSTLADVAHEPRTETNDHTEAIDWIVRDSVALAYDDWSDHLAHWDEADFLCLWSAGLVDSEVAL